MNTQQSCDLLLSQVRQWFDHAQLNHAVIGYSGGVDSALTAAVCHSAGISTTLVRATLRNQHFSSPYAPEQFAKDFPGMSLAQYTFDLDNALNNAGKEAALPIIRVSYFYAHAAQLREQGARACVVGTANFDEAAFLGFWGKSSDAAQDVFPISHLHKSQVVKYAKYLGVHDSICSAVPSGDLQFSGTQNDQIMIGATYAQIEQLGRSTSLDEARHSLSLCDQPKTVCENVLRNSFKYLQPFPGFHVSPRLEDARLRIFPHILKACQEYYAQH